jgi:hypothetical protein
MPKPEDLPPSQIVIIEVYASVLQGSTATPIGKVVMGLVSLPPCTSDEISISNGLGIGSSRRR